MVAATGQMQAPGSTRMAGEHSSSFPWVLFVFEWPQEGAACCRAGFIPAQLSLSGRALTDYSRGLTLNLIPDPIKLRTKVNYHQVYLSLGWGASVVFLSLLCFSEGRWGF